MKYHKIYHNKKAKNEDERETMLLEKVGTQKEEKMIYKLIQDLLSCPTHLCGIITPKKVVEKKKSKKKHSSCMYDDFDTHLIGTHLKTQESNMPGKINGLYPYIFTEKTPGFLCFQIPYL